MEDDAPSFPPLLRGQDAGAADPFDLAVMAGRNGEDPGLVIYSVGRHTLKAAMLLAPESPLEQAVGMAAVAAVGFSDALGALAPPEVAVHLRWPGTVLVNGAVCGQFRAAASTADPAAEPDWLVIGLTIALSFGDRRDPGQDPDRTALSEEGCAEIAPLHLLESWARHTLVWLNTWEHDGFGRVLTDWTGRAFDIGERVCITLPSGEHRGKVLGLDEGGGLLLKEGKETAVLPLTLMLDPMPC